MNHTGEKQDLLMISKLLRWKTIYLVTYTMIK